jgi:hypothetical protein
MVASCGMAVVCSAPKGEKGSIVPRNGLSTASLFELVQPLAEPTTDRAVMRAYCVNPISIFPGRAYEEDRVVRPFFGRPHRRSGRLNASPMHPRQRADQRRCESFPHTRGTVQERTEPDSPDYQGRKEMHFGFHSFHVFAVL